MCHLTTFKCIMNVPFWQVGLGTDVSGGFSPSMLTSIQHASMASKVIAIQAAAASASAPPSPSPRSTPARVLVGVADSTQTHLADRAFPIATLLHMATLGGAGLCNLEAYTGSLGPGQAFDALLVNLRPETGNPNVWWDDSDEEGEDEDMGKCCAQLEAYLEKFFFCGDDRNISAVWVQGKLVGGRQFDLRGGVTGKLLDGVYV
jgi:guanine deaminase